MNERPVAREALWEVATNQFGFVTTRNAKDLGIDEHALRMLAHRGTLERAAFGVYRFPNFPASEFGRYMLALLWTRAPEACLSHETALDAYGISDVNPNRIHVTVGRHRRLRRKDNKDYVIHYEDLESDQVGWWEEIPTVTAATAIRQCIDYGTPTYLLRQAIERGRSRGYLRTAEEQELVKALEERVAGG